MDHPLLQLAHLRRTQNFIEFLLAEQHDLQQLVALGFQIRQKPDFFQGFDRHGVRFVDQDHHAPSLGIERDQSLLQAAQNQRRAVARVRHIEIVEDRQHDFVARQRRVGQVDGLDLRRQALHEHPAQHGFAAAYLAGYLDNTFIMRDRIQQCFKCGAAIGAFEEKVGMRGDAIGCFGKTEMVQVHVFSSRVPAQPCANKGWFDSIPAGAPPG